MNFTKNKSIYNLSPRTCCGVHRDFTTRIRLFLTALAIIFFFVSLTPANADDDKKNPVLIIPTIDGKIFNLEEQKGKIIIVNFWAKWCVECRKEMAILEEIQQKYQSQNLQIIAINIDKNRARKEVNEIAKNFSYQIAMLIDAKENNFPQPNQIPTSYIIDKNGKIAAKIIPLETLPNKEDFERILEAIHFRTA